MSPRNADEQFSEDAGLDELLSAARWPELSSAAQVRLRDRIAAQRPSRARWISGAVAWSALAAGVAIVVGMTTFVVLSSRQTVSNRPVAVSLPTPVSRRIEASPPPPAPLIVSRPANQYELL